MAEGARVQSVDAIKEFRVYLAKFGESCSLALGDAESEISKTLTWIEGEQQSFWNGRIRKCQEILVKAEEAYRHKKLYKDASGSTPSAIEELKAVNIAKKNLADAQTKLANTKKWVRQLQKEMILYRGGVARFASTVSSAVPQAIAQLASIVEQLEKYLDIEAEAAAGAPTDASYAGAAGSGPGGPSMSRSPDVAPPAEPVLDIKVLRAAVPVSPEAISAVPLAGVPVQLPPAFIPAEQQRTVRALGEGIAVTPGDRVVLARGADAAKRLFIARIRDGENVISYIAPVDATAVEEYTIINTADFVAGQADLRSLLCMPIGFLAVIDPNGLVAVFDETDENRLKAQAPPPVATPQ
jgi:hypothetical protein